jgi:hypothetical protein
VGAAAAAAAAAAAGAAEAAAAVGAAVMLALRWACAQVVLVAEVWLQLPAEGLSASSQNHTLQGRITALPGGAGWG